MKNPHSQIFIDDGLRRAQAAARYRKRRGALFKKVGCPIIIAGVDNAPGDPHPWAHLHSFIYQDPLFLYLTGINQPHCVVAMVGARDILFVQPKNPKTEFWEGARFGVGDAIPGFSDIRPLEELPKFLATLNLVATFWHQSKVNKIIKDHNYALSKQLKSPKNISDIQYDLRQTLDAVDLDTMRLAQQKSAAAFKETLKNMTSFHSESEVAAFLDGQIAKQSYFRNSFPSIVAGGKNAAILHYTKNNDPLDQNELLLMDFGVRWHSMHADISRTIPLSGKFNPVQRRLYEIVLGAQDIVENNAKVGVTINQLNDMCWSFVNAELHKNFKKIKLPYEKQPHNVGHLLGRQVHEGDAFREYRDTPLKAGWVITNEPGIYGEFDGQAMGIRIEDNLLIKKHGCENLSSEIPKSIRDIEKALK